MNSQPTPKELVEVLTAARNLLSNIVFGGAGGVKLDGRHYKNNREAARAVLDRLQSAIDGTAHEPPQASKARALELSAMDPEWLGMSERREALQLLRQFARAENETPQASKDQLRRYRFTKSGMFHNEAGEWVSWFDHNQEIARLQRELALAVKGEICESCLERVRAENEPCEGLDTPWPLRDVLAKLIEATEHLLYDHACDTHGHEEYRAAVNAGKTLQQRRAAQPPAAKQAPTEQQFIDQLYQAGWRDTCDAQWEGAKALHRQLFGSTP